MIEVTGLVKNYGIHCAVDNLSFTIGENEIFGFLGPNGAGKSTTMNMITGCLAATEGEIKINGVSMIDDPEEAKKFIGYLPEIPPIYDELTPWEYLLFVGRAKKISNTQLTAEINEVMEETDIAPMKNRLIKNLSKGYRQRVGIAEAILGKPQIIILDEPTVGLDPQQIIEIRKLIKKLGEKHTVILSSHILSEISAVCDHIMIINEGKLVTMDTTQNLMESVSIKTALIEIKGDEKKAQHILEGIDGVSCVTKENNEKPRLCSFSFKFKEEKDPRENIFYAFSAEGMPIMAETVQVHSLEEIFLNVVQEKTAEQEKTEEKKPGEGSEK